MFNFSGFQVLTFDCYGTLIDWESGILGALRPVLAAHGKNISDAGLLATYGELEAEAEQGGYRAYREVLQSVVRGLGARLGFSPSESEARSLPDSLTNWRPFPDTVEALRRLKARYRLAVISNIDDDLFAGSARQLAVAFDFVVTAQQARCYKPDHRIFNLALDRIGVAPEAILHCAQSIYHDVAPANALGLASVWVHRPSQRPGAGATRPASAKPDLEVSSLKMLADVVCAGN